MEFHALSQAPQAPLAAVRAPRIALYKSWVASMPEGWTRWLLEQYGFGFQNITDAQIRAVSAYAYSLARPGAQ